MNEEILKKLYESAKSVFDMPSYEQFALDMQDDTKLNAFRQSMSQHYDMPEIDKLKADLGFVKKKEDTESASLDGSLESLQINDDQLYAANKAALSAIGVPSAFGGFLSNALTRGISRGAATDETLKVMYGGKDVTDEDLDKFIRVNQMADAMGQSDAMIEFNKGYEEDIKEGSSEVWSFMKNLAKNPSVASEVMITSLAQMASGALSSKEGFGVVAAGAGTGASIGFGLGTLGGPLAPATSTIGAITGSIKGAMSAAGGLTETTASFVEFVKEELKDKPFTQENIREVLANEEAKQRIINRSLARGATITAIDFLAAGASGTAAKSIKTVGRTGKVARGAATTTIEALGGAGGEIGGRLAAGQELDTREILFEAVGEVPGAAVSGPLGLMSAPKYKVNKGALSKNDFLKVVNTATDEEILSMDITIDNDEAMADIYNSKVERAKTKKNIDPTITEQEDIDAVVDREIEIKELKKKESYSAKNRVKELQSEIAAIQEKYKATPSTEETSGVATEPVVTQPTPQKVADVINRPVTLTELGGSPLENPIEGDMYVEGQQVVLEDADGNLTEIGNVDEISDSSLEEMGIKIAEPEVKTMSDGNLQVGEDILVPDKKGIKRNKRGEISRVVLRNEDGSITRTLRGTNAEEAAYQILLKEATSPEQAETINQLLEQDDEFRQATGITQATTDQDTQQVAAGNRLINEPLQDATEISNRFTERKGLDTGATEVPTALDTEKSTKIAKVFDKLKPNPKDPKVKKAYKALATEVLEQYQELLDAGYTIEIVEGEPYKNSADMIADLRDNKRIRILSTEAGFGSDQITDQQREDNPMLDDSGIKDANGKTLLVNDVFRAVHDFFGHAKLGNSFGPKGEEIAWRVHSKMFSPDARRAMTTETRGQNSWVNFSGINEAAFAKRDQARSLREQAEKETDNNKKRALLEQAEKLVDEAYAEMRFAEQKIGLLPDEFVFEDEAVDSNIDAEVDKLSDILKGPNVKTVIDNVKKALSAIAPDVKFVIHNTEEAYAKATDEQDLSETSAGSFNPKTRVIHINAAKADARTVYHEAFHAMLLTYVKSNAEAKVLTERMIKAVMKAAPDNVKAELEAFAANYDANIQSEEKLAELFGILASEYKQLPTNTQGIVKRFLDRIAKALGLKPFTDSEVIDVLNSLAGKVSRGETIQQADISSVVEKTSNYEYISDQNADTWADDMVRKQKRTKPDPVNTVKAYKLFRVKPNEPGKLFPLFVNADEFIEIGSWIDAEVGELTNEGKVKSKIGNLAYRPGWHMGDLPIATHIGDKYNFKKGTSDKSLKKPTARSADHVWAEVEVAADVNWQEVANKRASKTKDGKVIPRTAHITDQIPEDGYYRYKTNPNMTGEWLISGSIKVTRALTDEEVIEINNAAGVADLPRVKPIDLKKLGFEVKADTEALSVRKRKIGNFEVSYFEDAKEFKDLVEAGLVVNNYDINQLDGVKVAVHQPDNMFVGTLLHKGNQFFKGQGGVFYTPSTGNVWASGSENSANSLAKLINNSEVDGVRRMALVRGTDPKMLSSTEGVKAAMSIVELMVDDGLIPRKDFRSSLIRVGKKYNVDFSGSDSSASIKKDIEDKFMKPTDSTFQKRGFFFEDLIDDLSKTSTKTKENSDKIREFLGFNKRKITFGKDGVKDAIGNLLTERLLVDLPNSHVYAIIETTSEVVVRPATKEEISNPEHGSYPFVLVTKDGSKPVLKLLSYRPHAVKDGVFRLKDGSEPSQAKLGLAQRGMGEAVVTSRKQQNSPIYKIISKGKENGISDAAILKYLRDNGFDVNEGYDILDSINQQERKAKQRAEGLFDPEKNVVSKFLDTAYKTLMSGRGYRPISMQLLSEYKDGALEAEIRIARKNVKKIERAIKGVKDKKAVIESIDKFMRGEKDHNVPASMMGIVSEMRTHLDNLSKKLVDSGAVPSEESRQNIINNLGSYLNRSYEVYDNKNYAKKVTAEVKQAAKNKLREIYRDYAEAESLESGVPVEVILKRRVDQAIDGILNQDEGNEFIMRSKEGAKNLTPLEQRKDIPAEIRALMGEYGDPAMNYVRSIQKVAAIIANQNFQKQLRNSGEGVYLFTEKTGIYNVKIAGDSSESMDVLAGMYTSKDIAEAMSKGGIINLDFGKFQPIYDFYLKSVGAVKYTKTILSLGTHAKNVIGNIPFMLMTGNFNLTAFNQAIQALRAEYSENGKPELLAKMDEYTRLGIINQSTTLNEIKDLLSSGKTFEDVMIDRTSDSNYTRVKKIGKGFLRASEKAYQVEDDFFKIAAYESEKVKYAKSVFKKNINELTESELKETSERAATVVKNVLPNYSRVGGYVKLLKALPIAGTFISFTSESVRTSYNTIDLTFKEIADPKTRSIGVQRLAGIMSLAAVKAGIIAMWGLSADDEDEDELKNAKKFLPFWDTNATIAPTEIKDGELKYRSISASDPHGYMTKVFNAYMNSDNYNEGLTNALKEAYQPWLNPDMTFSVVSELISNRDKNGKAIFKEGDTAEDKALKITQKLWKIAEPGTVTSAIKIAKSENPGNEAIGQFTGFKEHTVDILETLGYKSSDLQRRANESASDYSKAKRSYERGEITIEQLSEQYNISNERKKAVYQEAIDLYNGAMYLGVDPREIEQKMMDWGIPRYVVIGIQQGFIPDMNE